MARQRRIKAKVALGGFNLSVKAQTRDIAVPKQLISSVLVPWVTKETEFAARRAKLLAPIGPTLSPQERTYKTKRYGQIGTPWQSAKHEGGDLRASIHATPVLITRNGVASSVQADTPYALRMHEELTPAGTSQLGYTSKRKRSPKEGPIGGRYIERVFDYHRKKFEQDLADMMVKFALRKGKKNDEG